MVFVGLVPLLSYYSLPAYSDWLVRESKDWLQATNSEFHSEEGLNKLKSLAFYYKRCMGGSVKKDIRIPGFATLHDYYQHEFRKRTDIEYDC